MKKQLTTPLRQSIRTLCAISLGCLGEAPRQRCVGGPSRVTVALVLFVGLSATRLSAIQTPEPGGTANQNALAPSSAPAAPSDSSATKDGPYTVVERGPDHAVWQRLTVDAQGRTNAHSYTELASGLNFWNPASKRWEETKELFQITESGYAIATNGQHKVIVAPDIVTLGGTIDFLGPDSQHLLSGPMGLAFRDSPSGKTVLIAGVTNCVGELAAPNVIVFPKAFDSIKAAISYTYRRAGLEQDVILYQQLPSPADYGFDRQTTVVEIWTEFFSAPQPIVNAADVSGDQALDFGATRMGHGVAYLLNDSDMEPVPLQKTWVNIDERRFLVESIPYRTLEPLLAKLQAAVQRPRKAQVANASFSDQKGFVAQTFGPKPRVTEKATVASIQRGGVQQRAGLCLDYETVNTSLTNFTFASDTNYYVSSSVSLRGTNNVIQGGTVIKFTNSTSAKLNFLQPGLVCATGPYRMAILTSKDDNSVGETISGSTGSPTNSPGSFYLYSPGTTLQYLRFSSAGTAVYEASYTNAVRHCQFLNCGMGIQQNGADLVLRNVLFVQCSTCVKTLENLYAEHLTVDGCSTFAHDHLNLGWITNSIFTGVSSMGPATLYYCVQQPSSAGIYQAAGAGSYYLCDGSTNRNSNIATTNINPSLLAELRQKTTYPPIICTNTTWTADTTLSPQARRDTDTPDLGYHYDPIDFVADNVTVTNAVLTVTPGTTIAGYNDSGIWLREGSSVSSVGTPLTPIWFIRYQSVQEQPISLGPSPPSSGWPIIPYHTNTPFANGVYRFTRFACPAGGGLSLYHTTSWAYGNLLFADSEIWGGGNKFEGAANTVAVLNNNLFHRGTFYVFDSATNSLAISNNLFRCVTGIIVRQLGTSTWAIYNNEFDSCSFGLTLALTSSGNNAYWNCNKQLNPTNASDITLTNAIAYEVGPLGAFYQPTNSPLINTGSCTADVAGLYHYCTTTNQAKEATSTVDVGYHYIACDANGNPLTDGDGTIPDYAADKNGNGVLDFGEVPFAITIDNPANGSVINK